MAGFDRHVKIRHSCVVVRLFHSWSGVIAIKSIFFLARDINAIMDGDNVNWRRVCEIDMSTTAGAQDNSPQYR